MRCFLQREIRLGNYTLHRPTSEASELDLAEFELSVATVLTATAREHGKWQALTPFAVDHVERPAAPLIDDSERTSS